MEWVKRNGREYYYRSVREGGRVRKIYVGKGDIGKAAEYNLLARNEQRTLHRAWLDICRTTYDEVDLIDARLTVELSAVLLGRAGIHLDGRLARRILRANQGRIMGEKIDETILPLKEQVTWQQLSERASRGDREAAAALIPMLDSHPELVARWGDTSNLALNRWLDIASGDNELTKQAILRHVLDLVKSIRRFAKDPLEDTMCRRVASLWLQANYFDSQLALATKRMPAEQKFLVQRQKDAQQLYEGEAKALQEYQSFLTNKPPTIFDGPSTVNRPR